MIILFKYIFYKVYKFYIQVFKEKAIPHWFAAEIVSILMIGTFQVLADSYSYFFNPKTIGVYTVYNKYLVLLLGFLLILYVNKGKRYLKIIDECSQLNKNKQKILLYISVLYFFLVIISFFWIGFLIREYNIKSIIL